MRKPLNRVTMFRQGKAEWERSGIQRKSNKARKTTWERKLRGMEVRESQDGAEREAI